jgi:hypothetical protein
MSSGDSAFENLLMGATGFIGLMALIQEDNLIYLLLWLIALAALQILHSIVIATSYWKNIRIRSAIGIYWIVSAIDLFIVFSTVETNWGLNIFYIFVIVLPLCIAIYLWLLTWYFRRETIALEKEEERQRQLTNQ